MSETRPKMTAADLRYIAANGESYLFTHEKAAIRAGADAMDERDRLAAELARLRAENAELAEALRPFAIGEYPNRVMPDDSCLWEIPAGRSDGVVLDATVGDSRRAAAVLAKRESVV